MVSQNAIPSRQHLGGALPFAFTEHGILMLANTIKSDIAIQMSIRIIELFIKLRELVLSQKDILLKLESLENKILNQNNQLVKHDEEIQILYNAVKQLLDPPQVPRKQIGFKTTDNK